MISPVRMLRTALLGLALACLLTVCAAAATLGTGTVTADALRLRAQPGTDSAILATAVKGEEVSILEAAADGWYQVDYQGVTGYMSGDYLEVDIAPADVPLGYGAVDTDGSVLNVRSGPDTSYARIDTLSDGTVIELKGETDGWYQILLGQVTGYVSSEYITLVDESQATAAADLGSQIVAYAKTFLGTPYVYGADGPRAFDCSGFTHYVYAHFGYSINRGATGQLSNGTKVKKANLAPGDLVFFYDGKVSTPVSHVGIYIGGGQFIHASTNGYKVIISDLTTGSYARKYVYARRII